MAKVNQIVLKIKFKPNYFKKYSFKTKIVYI